MGTGSQGGRCVYGEPDGILRMITDEQAAGSPILGELLGFSEALIGRVPNSQWVCAHFPIAAAWQLPFGVSLQRQGGGGRLDGRTKQLVILATSVADIGTYCTVHNTTLAQATGLALPEIYSVVNDGVQESDALSDRDKAVLWRAEAATRSEAARANAAFGAPQELLDEAESLR